MRKLEIGSGNRPQEGFEHLDLDANCPHLEYVSPMDNIPVENNTFDEISAVHVIEHQSWRDTEKILREWYRVLNQNGTLYIATPNLIFIAKMVVDAMNGGNRWIKDYNILHPDEKKFIDIDGYPDLTKWANFKLFSSTGNGDNHYACHSAESIIKMMKLIGFKNITIRNNDDSLVITGQK